MPHTRTKKEKKVKAWAVVMFDGFLPDFTVKAGMENIYQIHSSEEAASQVAKGINSQTDEVLWFSVPCTITYKLPSKTK